MGSIVVRYSVLIEVSQQQTIFNRAYPVFGHVFPLHYPLSRRRPPGLRNPVYKRNEGKGIKEQNNYPTEGIV
jgi:hypothetical protein